MALETSTPEELLELEKNGRAERTKWVLSAPDPPSLWRELMDSVLPEGRKLPSLDKNGGFKPLVWFQAVFPVLCWSRNYTARKFRNDLLARLTLASICIPQIYAVMGTSREIAIGPVAVVSLLLASMIQKVENPAENPVAYRDLVE